ncbi:MAG: GAF domain-containing protein, partial [Omnitrophica WOR_2 bacterium]
MSQNGETVPFQLENDDLPGEQLIEYLRQAENILLEVSRLDEENPDETKLDLSRRLTAAQRLICDVEDRLSRTTIPVQKADLLKENSLVGPEGREHGLWESSQAEQKLQHSNEMLALLNDAAVELLAGADPIKRLDDFFKRASQSLGLEVFVQYNVSSDGTHLELGKLAGFPERYHKILSRLEFGQAVCGTVAQTRRPGIVTDVQNSKDRKTRLIRKLGITTYACHPLIVGNRLIGTLSFGSRTHTSFTPETISLLRSFCNMVAVAIARKQDEQALR